MGAKTRAFFALVLAASLGVGCDDDAAAGDGGAGSGDSSVGDGGGATGGADGGDDDAASAAGDGGAGTTGSNDAGAVADGSMTSDSGSGGGGGSTEAGNPCGDQNPVAGDAFDIDFGSEGKFTFDGTTHNCQLIGIHTGTWSNADGTSFSFSGSSMDPFTPTGVGDEITVTELKWQRSARQPGAQSDQFGTTMAKVRVIKGGPFEATNLGAPATVCIYDVEMFNHPNEVGVSAAFPGPVALACNSPM